MEEAIIAVGSNLGDRLAMIQKAASFLEKISILKISKSSIWESEPIGNAKYTFLNCAAKISVDMSAQNLLKKLKQFELKCGRDPNAERWSPRVLDLDIIRFGEKIIHEDQLTIPHPELKNRLFVLLPVQEIFSGYIDSRVQISTEELIDNAPAIKMKKTKLEW